MEPAESCKITVMMADLNREISIRSILKLVIVLVVTTEQGDIWYIYTIVWNFFREFYPIKMIVKMNYLTGNINFQLNYFINIIIKKHILC